VKSYKSVLSLPSHSKRNKDFREELENEEDFELGKVIALFFSILLSPYPCALPVTRSSRPERFRKQEKLGAAHHLQ